MSSLYRAEPYDEIVALLDVDWEYQRWAVKSFAASGKTARAIRYAEECRSPWAVDLDIDSMCEEILLS